MRTEGYTTEKNYPQNFSPLYSVINILNSIIQSETSDNRSKYYYEQNYCSHLRNVSSAFQARHYLLYL